MEGGQDSLVIVEIIKIHDAFFQERFGRGLASPEGVVGDAPVKKRARRGSRKVRLTRR
jgi:hypothetical protein